MFPDKPCLGLQIPTARIHLLSPREMVSPGFFQNEDCDPGFCYISEEDIFPNGKRYQGLVNFWGRLSYPRSELLGRAGYKKTKQKITNSQFGSCKATEIDWLLSSL